MHITFIDPNTKLNEQPFNLHSKLSVLNFFQLWKLPFAQVIFDSDPALTGTADTLHVDEMSQAMIRYAHTADAHR